MLTTCNDSTIAFDFAINNKAFLKCTIKNKEIESGFANFSPANDRDVEQIKGAELFHVSSYVLCVVVDASHNNCIHVRIDYMQAISYPAK